MSHILKSTFKSFLVFIILIICSSGLVLSNEKLDRSLVPKKDKEEFSPILRDMGVVQHKAITKSNKFLLSSYMSLEFSDGPYTMYGLNINPGYALSDFWEIYLNIVPYYFVNDRSIVKKIENLELSDPGRKASIRGPKPKYQVGAELHYAFGYGKESVGLYKLLRSDTFLKFGAAYLKYEVDNGIRLNLALGKSFFLSQGSALRLSVGTLLVQTIFDNVKSVNIFAFIEGGVVFYF